VPVELIPPSRTAWGFDRAEPSNRYRSARQKDAP
jgi:hypothetical protein